MGCWMVQCWRLEQFHCWVATTVFKAVFKDRRPFRGHNLLGLLQQPARAIFQYASICMRVQVTTHLVSASAYSLKVTAGA